MLSEEQVRQCRRVSNAGDSESIGDLRWIVKLLASCILALADAIPVRVASKPDETINGRGGYVSPDAGQRPMKRPRAKTNARGPEQSGQSRTTGGV
jgi:hypothetical protein